MIQRPARHQNAVVISSLGDVQPLYPISGYGVDEAHVEQATAKLDALADQTGS